MATLEHVTLRRDSDSPVPTMSAQSGTDVRGRTVSTASDADRASAAVAAVAQAAISDTEHSDAVQDKNCWNCLVEWIQGDCWECVKNVVKIAIQYLCCCFYTNDSPLDGADAAGLRPLRKPNGDDKQNSLRVSTTLPPADVVASTATALSGTRAPTPPPSAPVDDAALASSPLRDLLLSAAALLPTSSRMPTPPPVLEKESDTAKALKEKMESFYKVLEGDSDEEALKEVGKEVKDALVAYFEELKASAEETVTAEAINTFLNCLIGFVADAPVDSVNLDICAAALEAVLVKKEADKLDSDEDAMSVASDASEKGVGISGSGEEDAASAASDASEDLVIAGLFKDYKAIEDPTVEDTLQLVLNVLEQLNAFIKAEAEANTIDVDTIVLKVLGPIVETWLVHLYPVADSSTAAPVAVQTSSTVDNEVQTGTVAPATGTAAADADADSAATA